MSCPSPCMTAMTIEPKGHSCFLNLVIPENGIMQININTNPKPRRTMSDNAQVFGTMNNDASDETPKTKPGMNLANLVYNHPIGLIAGAITIYAVGYQVGRNDSLEGIFRAAMSS